MSTADPSAPVEPVRDRPDEQDCDHDEKSDEEKALKHGELVGNTQHVNDDATVGPGDTQGGFDVDEFVGLAGVAAFGSVHQRRDASGHGKVVRVGHASRQGVFNRPAELFFDPFTGGLDEFRTGIHDVRRRSGRGPVVPRDVPPGLDRKGTDQRFDIPDGLIDRLSGQYVPVDDDLRVLRYQDDIPAAFYFDDAYRAAQIEFLVPSQFDPVQFRDDPRGIPTAFTPSPV